VIQLEQLKGGEQRRRLSLLRQDAGGRVFWFHVACMHLEVIVALGFGILLFIFIPQELTENMVHAFNEREFLQLFFLNSLIYLGMTFVAPFYVGGGFSLYINRRILIEGWDIELSFRRLVNRVQEQHLDQAKEDSV